MPLSREEICRSASAKLSAAVPTLGSIKALVGLDGFVDEIIAVVDKRTSLTEYEPVHTIGDLARKIDSARGQSSNYELVVKLRKLGGNGPIMANALASHGLAVTYVGSLGYPDVDPVFDEFRGRARVTSIAAAGHTDALEFADGKLMLGKHGSLKDVNWDNIVARIGLDAFKGMIAEARVVGIVNWTMLPLLSDVWRRLLTDVFPALTGPRRLFFADLCDPEKRTTADLLDAMNILSAMERHVDVVLGLNLRESGQVCGVLGLPAPADAEAAIEQTARAVREKMGVSCVIVHPRRGAAAATRDESATITGPFVPDPVISTGAGDHFNAGFCLGRVIGLSLAESLAAGVGTSGFYVRSAKSPTGEELAEFVNDMPPPQG